MCALSETAAQAGQKDNGINHQGQRSPSGVAERASQGTEGL